MEVISIMGLIGTNKTDGIDDIMADDVNSLANAITENEEELELKSGIKPTPI